MGVSVLCPKGNGYDTSCQMGFQQVFGSWDRPYETVEITYRSFPADLTVNLWGYRFYARRAMGMTPLAGARLEDSAVMTKGVAEMPAMAMAAAPGAAPAKMAKMDAVAAADFFDKEGGGGVGGAKKPTAADRE